MTVKQQNPTLIEEERLRLLGYSRIAGIDEAGRGPLAGPVVAAAVILPEMLPSWLGLVRDSKLLRPESREIIFEHMKQDSVPFGVGIVSHRVIDQHGIMVALRLAMRIAVQQLPFSPDFLLIDFVKLPEVSLPQKNITDGDALCASIAAASIVAKVTRDHLMVLYDRQYPDYGLGQHKGYHTPEHLACLQRMGPCPIHRKSFDPVRSMFYETQSEAVLFPEVSKRSPRRQAARS
ncbi:MAG: ribonuclease HII [Dehalococcoidia bacterium]|nr:ribonuclease HII [Dehalococcoidia bacterium]